MADNEGFRNDWATKDFYQVLGVAKDAIAADVKKAYRKLSRENHPDSNPGNDAKHEKFKAVAEAYDVVGDAEKRAKYDEMRSLHGSFGGGFGGGAGGGGGFNLDDLLRDRGGAGGGNVGDLFGDLFGGFGRGWLCLLAARAAGRLGRTFVGSLGRRRVGRRGFGNGDRRHLRGCLVLGGGLAAPARLFGLARLRHCLLGRRRLCDRRLEVDRALDHRRAVGLDRLGRCRFAGVGPAAAATAARTSPAFLRLLGVFRLLGHFDLLGLGALLGVLFLPVTTIVWVLVAPGGVASFDFLWLGIAVFLDVGSTARSAAKRNA